MNLSDNKGIFKIEYVPEDNLSKHYKYNSLPLSVQVTMGDKNLGTNGTKYISVGQEFFVQSYMEDIYSIQNGKKRTIVLNQRYPVPLTFSPSYKNCLIHLEKENVGNYASFDKDAVSDQIVPLDNLVFNLTDVINKFLFKLDEKQIYSVLDEVEAELCDAKGESCLEKMAIEDKANMYQFNTIDSARRALSVLKYKQEANPVYSDFMNSLTQRQTLEWNRILIDLKHIDPAKPAEAWYKEVKIMQQVPLS